jgi:hypothetical protein
MAVPDRAELPKKGNGLMPLCSLRGTGPVESTDWPIKLLGIDSTTKLAASTVHMRLDIHFTQFNIDKDKKFEHITGKKPHSFDRFLEEAILYRAPRPRTSVHYQGIPEMSILVYSFV